MSADLQFQLGLDTGPFKTAGQQAVNASSELAGQMAKKFEFRDVGRTLATALGLSLENIAENVARLFTGVTKQQEEFFKRSIELSDKTTEAYIKSFADRNTAAEKLRKNIEEQAKIDKEVAGIRIAQAERFAQAQKEAEAGFGPAAEQARFAQQTAAETLRIETLTARGAELKLEIDKATSAEKTKQLDRSKELHDFVFADAAAQRKIDEQNLKLEDEEYQKQHLQGEQARDALILQAKLISGSITPAERTRLSILNLQAKQLQINAEIDQALLVPANQRNEFQRQHLASLFSQNDKLTKQIGLLKDVGTAAGGVASIAEKVEESFSFALNKLKSFVDEWTGFTSSVTTVGRGNSALSDRELQRKIDETNKDIAARQLGLRGGVGGVGSSLDGPYDPFLGAQQSNLTQAQAELDFRNQVRRSVAVFGEDRAFDQFPGLTENRLREIVGSATDATRQTDIAQKTYDLLRGGIVTISKS